MPTTSTDFRMITTNIKTSYDEGKTWTPGYNLNEDFYGKVRTWPLTTKRAMPEDLYLHGTTRTLRTTYKRDSGYSFIAKTSSWTQYTNRSMYTMFVMDLSPKTVVSIDDDAVYNVIRSNIRGEATNLAQMLAEYAETAKLFYDLAKVVTTKGKSLFRKVGRNSLIGKRLNSYSKDVSGAYLQWTYGISPLCSDMVSALRELRDSLDHPLFVQGVESRVQEGRDSGSDIDRGLGTTRSNWECKVVLRKRYQWRAYLDKNALKSTLVAHGFANPLAVAYELVPFSFVVDWWVNVGEVLASLDNLILVENLFVLRSVSNKRIVIRQTEHTNGLISHGGATYYIREDTRYAPTTISKVSSFKYDPSVSKRHILNGLALLNQLRR